MKYPMGIQRLFRGLVIYAPPAINPTIIINLRSLYRSILIMKMTSMINNVRIDFYCSFSLYICVHTFCLWFSYFIIAYHSLPLPLTINIIIERWSWFKEGCVVQSISVLFIVLCLTHIHFPSDLFFIFPVICFVILSLWRLDRITVKACLVVLTSSFHLFYLQSLLLFYLFFSIRLYYINNIILIRLFAPSFLLVYYLYLLFSCLSSYFALCSLYSHS